MKRFIFFVALAITFSSCKFKCDTEYQKSPASSDSSTIKNKQPLNPDSTYILMESWVKEDEIKAGTVCIDGKKYAYMVFTEDAGYGGGTGLTKTGNLCSIQK